MSSFSLVFLYQRSLFRNLCICWSKPHKYTMKFHVLIKKSSLDSDLLLASNELSVNKLVSFLDVAVDKSRIRKHWNDDEWNIPLAVSSTQFPSRVCGYIIYTCFFLIEDNQITTYFFGIYGIWTPCIPCTPCTNDLNLLQNLFLSFQTLPWWW